MNKLAYSICDDFDKEMGSGPSWHKYQYPDI